MADKPKRGPISQEAIDFLEGKGLQPEFSYLNVWREEHDNAFTVAKVMEQDILADVQDSLVKVLKEGTTFREWAKGINEVLDKSGWSAYGEGRTRTARLNVIYDTNLRQARAVGQWQRIERTKEFRPYLRYALGPAEKHRPEHESWAGTILPVDDPWWDDHMPINGWLCKCHVIQETQRVVDRRGGPSPEAPESPLEDWKNPKTGKVEKVPKGIDPGFNYNPGKNRKQVLDNIRKDSDANLKRSTTELKDTVK